MEHLTLSEDLFGIKSLHSFFNTELQDGRHSNTKKVKKGLKGRELVIVRESLK